MSRRLNFCGWGYEGDGLTASEESTLLSGLAQLLGASGFERRPVPDADSVDLPAPRIETPDALRGIFSVNAYDRLTHTYGQSYPDFVRMFNGDFEVAPDAVAHPTCEEDVIRIFDWAGPKGIAIIPFGGGTSVVGGVEPNIPDRFEGAISLDMGGLNQVLEVDRTSRAALIQGGIHGPEMEVELKRAGLTMRHFPQSFERATLGGMIATRSGGHFATLYTHIDEFVENLRCVTPAGVTETRRLPGSGAGPSPDRLMIGSEGALGVITQAWMRLQDRPKHRASTAVLFGRMDDAVEAIRIIAQSGLYPANIRLLDPNECTLSGFGDGSSTIVVVAFENADHPVSAWMDRALEICSDHHGVPEHEDTGARGANESGIAGAWRTAFIRMPHMRRPVVSAGIIHDTFETAITWDRFASFHASIVEATRSAVERVTGGPALVSCRFTHVYPDGPAPYYTFVGQGRTDALADQWTQIKSAVSDAIIAEGGTITHHHAVGRDHMPWYNRQKPALFDSALKAAKGIFDPNGILNPGVLVDA